MLSIQQTHEFSVKKLTISIAVTLAILIGLYVVSLFLSPAVAHALFINPIDVKSLAAPSPDTNRLVLPKIGIDIQYSSRVGALSNGAQWRQPDLGNPVDGGNMVITARRFDLRSTPQSTIAESPFYTLNELRPGDKIIVDYDGIRYGYEVTDVRNGTMNGSNIFTSSRDPILTLYTYDAENDETRVVVVAKALGKVALE